MATGAGLAEWEQTHGKKKAKCVLTSTGLLMEGLSRKPLICKSVMPSNYFDLPAAAG
jgi:hypothetical protein